MYVVGPAREVVWAALSSYYDAVRQAAQLTTRHPVRFDGFVAGKQGVIFASSLTWSIKSHPCLKKQLPDDN